MASGDFTSFADVATRVGTASLVADSATWTTTETGSLMSVTASVITGQVYKIRVPVNVSTSAYTSPTTEISVMRLREDTSTGNQLQGALVQLLSTNANGFAVLVYAEYTAVSTGSKTFVLTGQRLAGSGNHQIRAGSTRPTYMTVDRTVS